MIEMKNNKNFKLKSVLIFALIFTLLFANTVSALDSNGSNTDYIEHVHDEMFHNTDISLYTDEAMPDYIGDIIFAEVEHVHDEKCNCTDKAVPDYIGDVIFAVVDEGPDVYLYKQQNVIEVIVDNEVVSLIVSDEVYSFYKENVMFE